MTSTSIRSEINVACVSDIHLGHPKTPSKKIVENFNAAFPMSEETAALDIIFLAGDVFDSLLPFHSEDVEEAHRMISRLLNLCKRFDITLRVLDGTKSHDHYQSKMFETLNASYGVGADVKYVKTVSIEYIERYGINVLYVPDESGAPEVVLKQVKELMKSKAIDKVDFAIMHGQFDYQLPELIKAPKHDSDEYSKLVDSYIFIGHVHVFSTYKNIIAQGSFDRIAQGEERAKGHVRARVVPGISKRFEFIENENAKIYKTINVTGMDIEDSLEYIDNFVRPLPADSAIRITAEKDHPIFANMDVLISGYPFATWTKHPISEDTETDDRISVEEDVYIPITITKENIEQIVIDRIAGFGPTDSILDNCKRILREVM